MIPDDFLQLFERQSHNLPQGVRLGLASPTLVTGEVVYGQFNSNSESGIGRIDLRNGEFERLVVFDPAASGVAWMAAEPPWLVWTLGNSTTNVADWSLLARNLDTGRTLTLATAKAPDGTFLFGQQPLPAIREGRVSWAQPLPKRGPNPEAEIHVYDLAAARDTVLATGRVSSPVYAGGRLIWASRSADDAKFSFQAVGGVDLRPIQLPERLRDPGSVLYLAGSAESLAWNADGGHAAIWAFDTSTYSVYQAPDLKHQFQFLQVAGPFLLWYGGITSSVLDLRTGKGFDVAGTLAASAEGIAASDIVRASGSRATGFAASRVGLAHLSEAPRISTCQP
ncbi:MAG: hypothetical protein M3T56_06025 [Chloroflexota bacterium]|nr:hypothetical protein [Chloroflexota bacterium]